MTLAEDVLALNGWSQQPITFRFDLLDAETVYIGDFPVFNRGGVTVENNINRSIKRQMSNVAVPPEAIQEVNLFSDRLRPVAIIGGVEYPLGVFIFTDSSVQKAIYGSAQYNDAGDDTGVASLTMLDQMALLDIAYDIPIAFRPGTRVVDALDRLLQRSAQWSPGISWELPESDSVIRGTEWFVKPPGTNLLSAMNDLCSIASFYSIYADNEGVFQIKKVPDIDEDPAFSYAIGTNVYEGSIVESTDLLNIPNRYIVINSALTEQAVYGSWDVPSESDYSIIQRGRVITKVSDLQGVNSNAEAKKSAKAMATRDPSAYEWVDFDASPNPLHDTFDVVSWDGNNYREQGWSLTLVPGGPHHHELRRIYNPDEEVEETPDEGGE